MKNVSKYPTCQSYPVLPYIFWYSNPFSYDRIMLTSGSRQNDGRPESSTLIIKKCRVHRVLINCVWPPPFLPRVIWKRWFFNDPVWTFQCIITNIKACVDPPPPPTPRDLYVGLHCENDDNIAGWLPTCFKIPSPSCMVDLGCFSVKVGEIIS